VVGLAEALFVRGNAVVLQHGLGVCSGYWHLSRIAVRPGQQVKGGELIGYVGSTGLSTGPHLHFEVRVHGVPTDPAAWLVRAP
jgi:murein DD-endopeptidase MepM/ murein hydrolase activator NlpD